MAVIAAAQLLDELMGKYRNVAPNEKVREVDWEDHEMCKFYMVKFCPHDLFVNTRADLGPCAKVHDDEAKTKYENAKRSHGRKMQYMEDYLRFCNGMLADVDRKIDKGRQRLALSGKNNLNLSNPVQAEKNQEQIEILNGRICQLEQEMEEAGIEGNVEQAQGLLKLCDQLKEERENLLAQNDTQWSATAQLAAEQEKQMEVCEVCGAFLIVGDAQQRIDDHLMGKQHMGYMRLKAAIDEITNTLKDIREEKKAADRALREQERERRKEKEKEKTKDSDKDVDKKDRKRSRSRNRDKSKDKKDKEVDERDKERDRRREDRYDRDRNGRDNRDRRDRDRDRRNYDSRDRQRYHGGSYRRHRY